MLRAGSGIIIVVTALHAVSAFAQSECSDDQRSVVSRPPMSHPIHPRAAAQDDGWCRSHADRLPTMDKTVCADRTLLDKHIRVGVMQRSLETIVGFPQTLRFEQAHRAWLGGRAQCTGPDVTGCLHRRYDARIQELAHSIATEPLGKP
jgi:hypothetical protein